MFPEFLRTGAVMLLAVCAALAADVSGKWEFSVETSQGSGNPSFELKQQGEKLTGTYSGRLGSTGSSRATRSSSRSTPIRPGRFGTKAL